MPTTPAPTRPASTPLGPPPPGAPPPAHQPPTLPASPPTNPPAPARQSLSPPTWPATTPPGPLPHHPTRPAPKLPAASRSPRVERRAAPVPTRRAARIGVTRHEFNSIHQLAVMVDTGPTLARAIKDQEFRRLWEDDPSLRHAFHADVGQSALNLEQLHLCHNDIRPSSITVRGGRFCLIDFDCASDRPALRYSPVLRRIDGGATRMRALAVAQIGLVVYHVEHARSPEAHGLRRPTASGTCTGGSEDRNSKARRRPSRPGSGGCRTSTGGCRRGAWMLSSGPRRGARTLPPPTVRASGRLCSGACRGCPASSDRGDATVFDV